MFDFVYPEIEDGKWLRPLLSETGNIGSEAAFGTLFIWKDTYRSQICRYGKYVLSCLNKTGFVYKMPYGGDEFPYDLIEMMIADAAEKKIPFKMQGIGQKDKEKLETVFPGRFVFKADRDNFDYIYKASDLINLSGRKYHGKRNHIAQFERKYDWEYEDITPDNIDDCRQIARQWCKTHGCKDENGFESETCALRKALENFQELRLGGGMIRVGGKPVAFTIGEEINSKVYLLHFEKALDGYDGLYALINHEFAARHLAAYEYVNREEDMGIDGLRQAKLSYHPTVLLQKYSAALTRETGEHTND